MDELIKQIHTVPNIKSVMFDIPINDFHCEGEFIFKNLKHAEGIPANAIIIVCCMPDLISRRCFVYWNGEYGVELTLYPSLHSGLSIRKYKDFLRDLEKEILVKEFILNKE